MNNTSNTTTISSPTITNLVEPSNGGAMTVPVSIPSPNLFGDNSPQKVKVKQTVKDTLSAKILLEMKNFSNSAPNSPLPTQAPSSPSFFMNNSSNSSNSSSSSSSNNSNSDQTVVTTCINLSPFNTSSEPIPIPNTPQNHHSHHSLNSNNSSALSSPTVMGTEQICLNSGGNGGMVSCSFKDCLLCKRGTPFVNNQSPTWACIMKIVFYCLQHEMPHKPFLNLKIDVYGFMTSHWHLLCLDKKRSDNWHKQIQDMLSHSKNLFESGMDTYKQNGYWRMRQISDPWEEIKSKKSSHHTSHSTNTHNSSHASTTHQSKRKRSYSENDKSTSKSKANSAAATVTDNEKSPNDNSRNVPTPISSAASVSSNSLLIPSSPVLMETQNTSHDDITLNNDTNNSSNSIPVTPNLSLSAMSTAPSTPSFMMSEKSIDKQIHDNFNQLSYQLKLNAKKINGGTSSSTINSLISCTNNNSNNTPTKGKKKLKTNHSASPMINITNMNNNDLFSSNNNNGSVMPPLPMIPSYLSGDIPSSPSLNFPNSPRPSPRNSPTPIILVSSTTTPTTPPVSSPFRSINDQTMSFIDNNNNENDNSNENSTTNISSSTSSTTSSSILSQLCEIYQQDRNETLLTIDNNKSLNSSFSNLSSSTPSSPITTLSNGDLNDEITLLKDQLRQITENLKSIKDNSQVVDKNSLSSMIEKEIDRISTLLFTHHNNPNNTSNHLIEQCKEKLLPQEIINTNSANNSSISSPIISIESPLNSTSNQKTVNLSITLEDCVPSRLSGLSALTMAATNY